MCRNSQSCDWCRLSNVQCDLVLVYLNCTSQQGIIPFCLLALPFTTAASVASSNYWACVRAGAFLYRYTHANQPSTCVLGGEWGHPLICLSVRPWQLVSAVIKRILLWLSLIRPRTVSVLLWQSTRPQQIPFTSSVPHLSQSHSYGQLPANLMIFHCSGSLSKLIQFY